MADDKDVVDEMIEDATAAPIVKERAETPLAEWETADEFAAALGLSDALRSARGTIASRSG